MAKQSKKDTERDAVLNSKEAAEYLGISYGALRKMRSRGDAPIHTIYGIRDKRYLISDLNKWIDAKRQRTINDMSKRKRGRPSLFTMMSRSIVSKLKAIKSNVDKIDTMIIMLPHKVIVVILLILSFLSGFFN